MATSARSRQHRAEESREADVVEKQEIMTLPEIAKYLGVSERTIYDWAQKGKIPAAKMGNAWRFKRSVIDRWREEKKK